MKKSLRGWFAFPGCRTIFSKDSGQCCTTNKKMHLIIEVVEIRHGMEIVKQLAMIPSHIWYQSSLSLRDC
jgi:hypothetical protein